MKINRSIFYGILFLTIAAPPAKASLFNKTPDASYSEESEPAWTSLQTKYCTIKYAPDVRLRVVWKRINCGFRDMVWDRNKPDRSDSDETIVSFRMDKLIRRVKEILAMNPPGMKFSIKIFRKQKDLDNHYEKLFHVKNTERLISYYVHAKKTIYTTERALNSYVIAHEIAHAIIRHYFLVRPPTNVDEVMAQYVELHLFD